jgi:hypothetical protein
MLCSALILIPFFPNRLHIVFFFGCSEISTIFLVTIGLAKFYPPMYVSSVLVDCVFAPLFVVFFFYYRLLQWWKLSYQLFHDLRHVLVKTRQASNWRPGRNHVLYVISIANLVLGILQVYWFGIILLQLKKMVQ